MHAYSTESAWWMELLTSLVRACWRRPAHTPVHTHQMKLCPCVPFQLEVLHYLPKISRRAPCTGATTGRAATASRRASPPSSRDPWSRSPASSASRLTSPARASRAQRPTSPSRCGGRTRRRRPRRTRSTSARRATSSASELRSEASTAERRWRQKSDGNAVASGGRRRKHPKNCRPPRDIRRF